MNKFIISWFKCTILLLRRVLFAQPFSTSGGWRRRSRRQQRLRGSFGNVKNEVEWCRRYTFVQKSGAPALQRRPGRLAPLYFVLPCVLRTRARQCFVRHDTVPPHALCSSRKVRRTQHRAARTIARQPHVSPHAAAGRRAAMPTVQCTKHPSLKNAHIESVRSSEYSVQKSRCMKKQVALLLPFSLCNLLVFLLCTCVLVWP